MISRPVLLPLAALGALGLMSCGKKSPTNAADGDAALAAVLTSAIDTSVNPCDDFYQYACGNWAKTTEIPADRVMWVRSFSDIDERNEALVRGILEGAQTAPGDDADLKKLGAFYGACMDTDAIEARGFAPVQPVLADIDALKTVSDVMAMVGRLQMSKGAPLFNISVYADFKDPSLNIAHFSQGGIDLPDREYYLKDDDASKALRDQYVAHVQRTLVLSGVSEADATAQASAILAFETKLAEVSIPREDLSDPDQTYHRIERAGLAALAPNFPWDSFFTAAGYPAMSTINVEVLGFFTEMPKIVSATDLGTLKAYLRYQVLAANAGALPRALDQEVFNFYSQTLRGQPEQPPRWRRCLNSTTAAMGELVGKKYVEKAFPGESKAEAVAMIQGIEAAFEAGLPQLAWMDDATRAGAVEKAKAISNKIGYPDTWRSYDGLEVGANYFENSWAAATFTARREGDKVGQPVDRAEWYMAPNEVNAYYNPLNNEIVFPAGILQTPFFDAAAPRAMNYGAIGMVMGHELSHGFDDSGRKFDPQGRMVEWWDPKAAERFEEAAACVSKQYSGYEVQPGVNLNGELTLGENIADNGGIKTTYRAYKAWEASRGVSEASVGGFTPDQQLFLSFAQSWCALIRPETEQVLVMTDSHSAPRYRVNGPLSNLSEFGEAFQCEVGSPMRPAETCTVW